MSEVTPGDLLNDLVDTHWETAARHAWRQYEQRGRGAIVFPVEPSSDGDRQPLRDDDEEPTRWRRLVEGGDR